jgi:hypothetical protein
VIPRTIVSFSAAALTAVACGGPTPPLTPVQIPAAFVALASAPQRTMHMEWTGSFAMEGLGAGTTPFTATVDFAGDDYAGTMSTQPSADGKRERESFIDLEIAFVGGQAYQRSSFSDGGWEKVENQFGTLDPMRGLSVDDLTYGGHIAEGDLHQLHIPDPSGLFGTLFNGLSSGLPGGPVSFDAASSTFDVVVDAQARPVRATLNLATGPNPTEFGTISLTSTYEFSNWGAEIYIMAPP